MDLANLPATRSEAKATGATHYFTGKPCKHGHIAARLTKGTCVVCREIEWKKENERRKHLPKSDAAKAAGRRYYQKNKDLVKRRASAQDRLRVKEYKQKWDSENKERRRILTNARRRRLRERMPKWVDAEHKKKIREKYEEAARKTKETGIKYVVDHEVPLQGEFVSGLHVWQNLTVITAELNGIKGNRFTPQ